MRPSRVLINPAAAVSGAVGAGPRVVVEVKVVAAVEARVDAGVKAEVAKVQTGAVRAEVVGATAINRYFFIALKLPGFLIIILSALQLAPGTKFQTPDAGVISPHPLIDLSHFTPRQTLLDWTQSFIKEP